MKLKPGDKVGSGYEILAFIGEGGMGSVYKAQQPGLERVVALKFLDLFGADNRAEAIARFEREAQALSKLRHKNIVSVYGMQTDPAKGPFLIMEFVDGSSLERLLAPRVPLDIEQSIGIAVQICEALQCAHKHGIVHRDIKPSNIIIDESGGIKLIDFGLIKLLPEYSKKVQQLTEAGCAVGSVLYMSPEQCQGLPCDGRSDIYSAGALLHHCLTGKPPFDGDHSVSIMFNHINEAPPLLSDACPQTPFPAGLQNVVSRAMAKHPEQRYGSPDEMAEQLRLVASGRPDKVAAAPPIQSTSRAVGGPARKSLLTLGLAALILLVAVPAASWLISQQTMRSQMQRLESEIEALQAAAGTAGGEANMLHVAELRLQQYRLLQHNHQCCDESLDAVRQAYARVVAARETDPAVARKALEEAVDNQVFYPPAIPVHDRSFIVHMVCCRHPGAHANNSDYLLMRKIEPLCPSDRKLKLCVSAALTAMDLTRNDKQELKRHFAEWMWLADLSCMEDRIGAAISFLEAYQANLSEIPPMVMQELETCAATKVSGEEQTFKLAMFNRQMGWVYFYRGERTEALNAFRRSADLAKSIGIYPAPQLTFIDLLDGSYSEDRTIGYLKNIPPHKDKELMSDLNEILSGMANNKVHSFERVVAIAKSQAAKWTGNPDYKRWLYNTCGALYLQNGMRVQADRFAALAMSVH